MSIDYEYNDISGSGSLTIYNSGNFLSGLYVDSVPVSLSGHNHTIYEISGHPVTGTGTANYITKWIDISGISNSNIYESENKIGINTTDPLADFHTIGSGIINTGIFSEIILTSGSPFNAAYPAKIKFGNGIELSVLNDSIKFEGFDLYSELLTINKSGISTPNVDNSQIHGGYF